VRKAHFEKAILQFGLRDRWIAVLNIAGDDALATKVETGTGEARTGFCATVDSAMRAKVPLDETV
jgi:hypothetical protein